MKPLDPTRPNGPRLSDGSLIAGEAANYTNFDSTGHQTMVGTAKPWEDLRIEPVTRSTGALAPTFSKWFDDAPGTSIGVFLYTFNDLGKKEVHFTMQLPHAYDGGPLELHVHWVGSSSLANAHPIWGLEHTWKNLGSTFGDTTLQFSDGYNYSSGGVSADITAGVHYISKFATIATDANSGGISSILIGRIWRHDGAGDTYNGGDCGLLYIDAHYQMNSLGSTDEYAK